MLNYSFTNYRAKLQLFFDIYKRLRIFFGTYIPVDTIIIAATFHKIHRLSEAKVSGGN
jgi:hypothetical protein